MSSDQSSAVSGVAWGSGRRRNLEPSTYAHLVSLAATQMRAQLHLLRSWHSVIVMPVAGFGDQYAEVLKRTLSLIGALGPSDRRLLVAVVNRPQHQIEDGAAAVLEQIRDAYPTGLNIVVCQLELTRKTRMGELRQLAVDALEQVVGELPPTTPIIICDDDVVALPVAALPSLELAVRRGTGLVVGPVLFDDPRRPMCLYGDLFAADVFRALLGRTVLRQWQESSFSPRPDSVVLESLVFSGNLAVSREALAAAGGFRDLNEITWLARDVLAEASASHGLRLVDPVTSTSDPAAHLLMHAVRMSSRRALPAWREKGSPTVAQWSAFRFTASRVDPARRPAPAAPVPVPVPELSAPARQLLAESFTSAVATTCRYLAPAPDLVLTTLAALGFAAGDVEMRPNEEPGQQVVVRRAHGFLDWLTWTQENELARWEAAADDSALPARLHQSDPA